MQLSLPLDIPPTPQPKLTDAEEKIYSLLTASPQHIDIIAEDAGISTSDALVTLLSLEFKNIVRQLPGKYFVRTE
jgi:DNA processing protein